MKLACAKVVKVLDPILREAEKGASWRDIIAAAQGDADGFTPTKVPTRQPPACSGGRSAGPPPPRVEGAGNTLLSLQATVCMLSQWICINYRHNGQDCRQTDCPL